MSQASSQEGSPPPDQAKRPPQAQPAEQDESLNALLDKLEVQGRELRSFTADILYVHYDELLDRRETRTGSMIYKVEDEGGARSFAVLFERLVVGEVARKQRKHYIFEGRWLVEVDHQAKQFIKREIVPPGRQLDPLKLGEGPIPLPIGQKRADVVARFSASHVELPKEGPLSKLEGVQGVRLVPRPGTREAQEFQQVDLFYDLTTGLPLGIAAIEANGNTKTVRLSNVNHNPELTPEQLAKLSVKEPDPREWAIDVERWRGSEP